MRKSSHENKKVLSPFYHKKIFLTENECKTPYGCHTFYQKYFHFIFFLLKNIFTFIFKKLFSCDGVGLLDVQIHFILQTFVKPGKIEVLYRKIIKYRLFNPVSLHISFGLLFVPLSVIISTLLLKSDTHVAEDFFQIKLFSSFDGKRILTLIW